MKNVGFGSKGSSSPWIWLFLCSLGLSFYGLPGLIIFGLLSKGREKGRDGISRFSVTGD